MIFTLSKQNRSFVKFLQILTGILSASLLIGCSMDDSDRCSKGYEWNSDFKICLEEDFEFDTATDTGSDTGSDSLDQGSDSDTATDTTNGEFGLGESCMTDDDCSGFEAAMCLKDPGKPDVAGFCTIQDCQPSDCIGDYSCCDCTESLFYPMDYPICVVNEGLDIFVGTLACTCQ
ncbi:MAG: hypothetical protein JXR91_16760 [Deltaproteobacteria bacterium]|nr:hypothetical protein [Deltaproteobacteria bacterium]